MDWILSNIPFIISTAIGLVGFSWGILAQISTLRVKQDAQDQTIDEITKVLNSLRDSHNTNSDRIIKLELLYSNQEKAMTTLIGKIDDLIDTLTEVRMTIERNGLQ